MNKDNQEKKSESKNVSKKKGVVVSDKMEKTIVVEVTDFKTHKKYQKKYRDSKRYKVHDEKNEFKVGDEVIFEETHPVSRDKKWKVTKRQN